MTRARQTLDAHVAALAELDARIEADVRAVESALDPRTEVLTGVTLKPRKTNVTVRFVTLAWIQ